MYAYFANEGCDPLAEGSVTNGNQVVIAIFVLVDGSQVKSLIAGKS